MDLFKNSLFDPEFGDVSMLPRKADIDEALEADEYDVPPFNLTSDRRQSFRNALEGERPANTMACGADGWIGPRPSDPGTPGTSNRFTLHNMVHIWVGGVISQGDPRTARRGTMAVRACHSSGRREHRGLALSHYRCE